MSDGEPACAATDTCEEAAEASLEETLLGENGGRIVNVTSVAVTPSSASSESGGVAAGSSGSGLRRWLLASSTATTAVYVGGDGSGRGGGGGDGGHSYYLRAGKRRLQNDGSGQTETAIEFVSSPDEASANPTTAAGQAAEQINALANGGVEDLLAELGLPADSDVTLDLTYVESEYREHYDSIQQS